MCKNGQLKKIVIFTTICFLYDLQINLEAVFLVVSDPSMNEL
jgi:hypothetical protein